MLPRNDGIYPCSIPESEDVTQINVTFVAFISAIVQRAAGIAFVTLLYGRAEIPSNRSDVDKEKHPNQEVGCLIRSL